MASDKEVGTNPANLVKRTYRPFGSSDSGRGKRKMKRKSARK